MVLVNSNPATIMTDPETADATYVEPITTEYIEKIIQIEKPDAILPTMGGQVALNAAVALHESGILKKYNIELIGSQIDSIQKAEDRESFMHAMKRIGMDMPRGGFVHSEEGGMEIIDTVGFPAIIRPSFTLGGTGGGIAYNMQEYRELLRSGLLASPVHRVLVEESIIGWKELELEVMRDSNDNVVIVCSIENVDPMGVHTGDSITVAPSQTLTDAEYQKMRTAALAIIREIGVETGGSNIQFALHPETARMVVIEMNPRVSRSSALASKATGFPIAKIAALLAVGYTLDELTNDITKKTPACFEPAIDYVVAKVPRWDFEKFHEHNTTLGVQMKSVGEAMAFGRNYKEALQKALRSIERGRYGFGFDSHSYRQIEHRTEEELVPLKQQLRIRHSESVFDLCDALRFGIPVDEISRITGYNAWFVHQCKEIVDTAHSIIEASNTGTTLQQVDAATMRHLKRMGFSDVQLAVLYNTTEAAVAGHRRLLGVIPVFKTVDTCAAEFESSTPYHYSTYEQENESAVTDRKKIIILGSGPNRIGQGIEFDYCCVQGVFALKAMGFETIMINCNPETVSTDYDTTDKLYFEPLTFEDIMHIVDLEKPYGVVVTFGGQTPLKLAQRLADAGVPIIGTSPDGIDLAEDRQRFGDLLSRLGIPCPPWGTTLSTDEAANIARRIGYPVLVRPSYVLGGRAMQICFREERLREYIEEAITQDPTRPVLIDHFLENASEFDVDAVSDGTTVVIGGIMQHIEEAGVHSGDSSSVLPPYDISEEVLETMIRYTRMLALKLNVVGLINLQFAVQNGVVYVLEVNPRASRTVPFVSKATGIRLAQVAARVMAGEPLNPDEFPEKPEMNRRVAIKESVFPFMKFPHASLFLGPEMRSTGEVMGMDRSFGEAIIKSHISAGNTLPLEGNVFISLSSYDKTQRAIDLARGYASLGFTIMATGGTATFLEDNGVQAQRVLKHYEGRPSIIDLIADGKIQLAINTPLGESARYDEAIMGRTAMRYTVPFFTTIAAAEASLHGIKALRTGTTTVQSLQSHYADAVSTA